MASINTKILCDSVVKVPPALDLQRKIAEVLNTSDELIKMQEDKLDHLKKLKQGLMQRMFM